jgi:uridylate kinase
MGKQNFGIDSEMIEHISDEVVSLSKTDIEIGIVIGGGNIFRGLSASRQGMNRVSGDYMGMLATTINSLALQNSLEKKGCFTRIQSAVRMEEIAEPLIIRRAIRHLEKKRIVIFAAGTGQPYFTTDTAAALRAIEINADILIKGTRVDGVYDSDPEKNPKAKLFSKLSYDDVIEKNLRVMDMTSITLCKENNLPIAVINMNKKGNLKKLLTDKPTGTIIR